MRLAALKPDGLAVVVDGSLVEVGGALIREGLLPERASMLDLIERYDTLSERLARLAQDGSTAPVDDVRLRAPVQRPSKLWCAAANYRRESGGLEDSRGRGGATDTSAAQLLETIFLKPSTAVIGPGDDVIIPAGLGDVFPEIELCVVIGKRAHHLTREQALEAVFGYTVILDMTARGAMWGEKLMMGSRSVRKGFDTFAPLGPWIVTRDEVPNPQALTMRLWVNGEMRQLARTDAMINGVAELVSYLSRICTLEPGDLIATGNPDHPDFQVALKPGDQLRAEIETVGELHVGVRVA